MDRLNQNTPPFFKKVRLAGLILTAIGGVLLAPPVALPLVLTSLGGYLLTAGASIAAVAQLTKDSE